GPDGGTGPTGRDSFNRLPPCASHHCSSIGLPAAIGGCNVDSSSRSINSCMDAMAITENRTRRCCLIPINYQERYNWLMKTTMWRGQYI
ncbi:hypothetical protein MUK42_32614, partial [Musa troglodytarum]